MNLTAGQRRLLRELDAAGGRLVVQINGTQLSRTVQSLRRKGLLTATYLKKPPGARYGYGYRGFELHAVRR